MVVLHRKPANIAIVGMFLVYGMHSAALVVLPFIRPELYRKARVKLHPSLLVTLGLASLVSMTYLTVVTLARDIAQHASLPPEQRGLTIWQLLLLWMGVGTFFYLIARWEGRRTGFDYKKQLAADWADD